MSDPWRERVEIGDAVLMLGDCREIAGEFRADFAFADPPYGVRKAEWDGSFPPWIVDLCFAVCPAVAVSPGHRFLPECIAAFGSRYKQIVAGRNLNGMTLSPIGFGKWIPMVVGGDIRHGQADAFDFAVFEEKHNHPSIKPYAFMRTVIDRWTEIGATVFDPMMGSGTTGVACAHLGRRFIGIEIDPKHFTTAVRRITEAQRQGRLFYAPKPQAEQLPLIGSDVA